MYAKSEEVLISKMIASEISHSLTWWDKDFKKSRAYALSTPSSFTSIPIAVENFDHFDCDLGLSCWKHSWNDRLNVWFNYSLLPKGSIMFRCLYLHCAVTKLYQNCFLLWDLLIGKYAVTVTNGNSRIIRNQKLKISFCLHD